MVVLLAVRSFLGTIDIELEIYASNFPYSPIFAIPDHKLQVQQPQ